MTATDLDDLYHALVAEDEQTCYACPTQWEGRLHDGRYFYFRYRHGWASLAVGDGLDVVGRSDTGMAHGGPWDGTLNDDEYRDLFLRLVDQLSREVAR